MTAKEYGEKVNCAFFFVAYQHCFCNATCMNHLTWIFANHDPYCAKLACLLYSAVRAVLNRFLISCALETIEKNVSFDVAVIFADIFSSGITELPTDHVTRLKGPIVHADCAPSPLVVYFYPS